MSEPVNQEGLTLTDLKNLLAIVDYSASQGAFKGWDTIKQVVAVRDKLATFIASAEPQQEEEGPQLQMQSDEVTDAPVQNVVQDDQDEEAPKKRTRKRKNG